MKNPESLNLLKELNFCVIDLETTGGLHNYDKIIEIGLVRIRNLKITKEYSQSINPEIKIPEFIQKLTHITHETIKDSPIIDDVINEIETFIGDDILVAHNISFDIPFINSVFTRLNKEPLINKSICTQLMTTYLIPNILSSNLSYICGLFNIELKNAHRALDDARASANLFLKYLDIFAEKGIKKANHLYYPRNKYELDVIHIKKDSQSVDEIIQKIKQHIQKNIPTFISIKGEKGNIILSSPLSLNKNISLKTNERLFGMIKEKLKQDSWSTLTLKIFAHILEPIFCTFSNIQKLKKQDQIILRSSLIQTFLNSKQQEIIKNLNESHVAIYHELSCKHQFIIIPNLVPEQFSIFCSDFNFKTSLRFRFPAHKKRLMLFINNKTSKLKNSSLTKHLNQTHKLLLLFIIDNLAIEKNIFTFSASQATHYSEDTLKELEKFISFNVSSNNALKNNYPNIFFTI